MYKAKLNRTKDVAVKTFIHQGTDPDVIRFNAVSPSHHYSVLWSWYPYTYDAFCTVSICTYACEKSTVQKIQMADCMILLTSDTLSGAGIAHSFLGLEHRVLEVQIARMLPKGWSLPIAQCTSLSAAQGDKKSIGSADV